MFSESMKDGRTPAMFIGRERELTALNTLYESDRFEFVVIYGRRRVGKTALISRFIEDKNAIYFMGVEQRQTESRKFQQEYFELSHRHGRRNLFYVLSGSFRVCVQTV